MSESREFFRPKNLVAVNRGCQRVVKIRKSVGGQGVNRTLDTRIFSPLLYRLSYLPTEFRYVRLMRSARTSERIIRTDDRRALQRPTHRLRPATRDSTKSINLPSRFAPSSRSISCTPVGLVTFTSVR